VRVTAVQQAGNNASFRPVRAQSRATAQRRVRRLTMASCAATLGAPSDNIAGVLPLDEGFG